MSRVDATDVPAPAEASVVAIPVTAAGSSDFDFGPTMPVGWPAAPVPPAEPGRPESEPLSPEPAEPSPPEPLTPEPLPGDGALEASPAESRSEPQSEPPAPTPPAATVRDPAARYLPTWCGWLLLALGVLTVPWIAGIVEILPSRAQTAHYDVSWAGFDVLLCLLLLRTGWSVLRDKPSTTLSAAMAGSLLIVDAWFDVMSAASTTTLVVAIAMAALVELPLAVFCLWAAGHVELERRSRFLRTSALVRRLDALRERSRQAGERVRRR